jgi:hypothetical protein
MTNKLNAWDWDLRVRERNLRQGVMNEKDVEKYLSGVVDSAENSEPFGTPQPALDQPDEPEMDDTADADEPGSSEG